MDWRRIQTLVRSMPGLHKTLIIACVKPMSERKEDTSGDNECVVSSKAVGIDYTQYKVEELAIASEHAPFKHKNVKGVGMQVKPAKS